MSLRNKRDQSENANSVPTVFQIRQLFESQQKCEASSSNASKKSRVNTLPRDRTSKLPSRSLGHSGMNHSLSPQKLKKSLTNASKPIPPQKPQKLSRIRTSSENPSEDSFDTQSLNIENSSTINKSLSEPNTPAFGAKNSESSQSSDNAVYENLPVPKKRTSLDKYSKDNDDFDRDNIRSNSTSSEPNNQRSSYENESFRSKDDNDTLSDSYATYESQIDSDFHEKTNLSMGNIYEELSSFSSRPPSIEEELIPSEYDSGNDSQWIDIESNDLLQKNTVQVQIIINQRFPNVFRRKSTPKNLASHKKVIRKLSKELKLKESKNVTEKITEKIEKTEDSEEYEDIENDENNDHYNHVYETLPEDKSKLKANIKYDPRHSAIIQELNSKLNSQKSNNDIINTQNMSGNSYSATPHQSPKLEFKRTTLRRKSSFNSKLKPPKALPRSVIPKVKLPYKNQDINNDDDDVNDGITLRRRSKQQIGLPQLRESYASYIEVENGQNSGANSPQINTSLFGPIIPFENTRVSLSRQQTSIGSVSSYIEFTDSGDERSPFSDEPLYQFYQKDVQRRAELWMHADPSSSDIDNAIYDTLDVPSSNSSSQCNDIKENSNSDKWHITAMDCVSGPNRSLWCQLPQVIKSNLLSTLTNDERKMQEAMYEIITSEASYNKSLKILCSHFVRHPELSGDNPNVINLRERRSLFSNILEIYTVSCNLLNALEYRFQKNILLYDICNILNSYAQSQFSPYIRYCKYQKDQEKILKHLKQIRPEFNDLLTRLESNSYCQMQTLHSFLILPMQRITRYPMLVNAVCQYVKENSPITESCENALTGVNGIARKCNDEAKRVQQIQELLEIGQRLHFDGIKIFPIISESRSLVKSGQVLRLNPDITNKRAMGKSSAPRWTKSVAQLFLFTDILLLTKKKTADHFTVIDYCSRDLVDLLSLSDSPEGGDNCYVLPIPLPQNHKNLAQLILHSNHKGKSVEHTLSFLLESERTRWIDAVRPPVSNNPNETIYEEWDCPQVQCIMAYNAKQPDELSLEETDVVNVLRKMRDGWYEGERIRDGAKGWFPMKVTEEIINRHVRVRNLRLRHRLLMHAESFIEGQKRNRDLNSPK